MQMESPSFPKLAVLLGVAGVALGFGVSYLLSPRYLSTATMMYEDTGSVAAGPHESMLDRMMATQVRVLSRDSLTALIQANAGLYNDARRSEPLEDTIERMRRNLRITIQASASGSMAFQIAFTYPDAVKAQQTVNSVIARFLDEEQVRRAKAEPDGGMLKGLTDPRLRSYISRLQSRIGELEKLSGVAPAALSSGEIPDSVRLQVIDPPSLPADPVYPNRGTCALMGFVAGIVLALLVWIFGSRARATVLLPT